MTGAECVQALRLRRVITAAVDAVLSRCDAIPCATTTGGAPPLNDVDEGPFRRVHPVTALFNATAHPAAVRGGTGRFQARGATPLFGR